MTKKGRSLKRHLLRVLFCTAAISILGSGAAAQSPTFSVRSYPLIGNNHVAADLNGDGKLDLAGAGGQAASVMLNNGDGTFQPKVDYPLADWSQALDAGDFNSDGKLDLMVTINSLQTGLSLLTGNGDGTFGAPVNFPNTSGFDSPSVAAVDLNNDGRLDVVVMHSIACYTAPCVAAESITVMLGNGDGTFQPAHELPGLQYMHAMSVGDFNADGRKDLAIGAENTQLYILLGVGDGTFRRLPTMLLIPGGDLFSACNDVDVADFNRDTIQDLVIPLGNGYGNVVLLGNGDGTFRQSSRITENATSAPLNLAVADYNGDGLLDIARAMGFGTSGLMEIANGNGDGTFQAPVRYLVPPPLSSTGGVFISSSDFNADSKPDIALLVGGASAFLDVLINSAGTPPPPAPLTVSSLTLSSNSVTGGNSVTATLRLSAAAQAATTVQLSSSSSTAGVPSSVIVPSGASAASFTVNTTQVTATTAATITATLNNSSRSVSLTVNAASAPAADTVSITRAEYDRDKRELRVEARSSRSDAALWVFVTSTNQLIGTLTNNGGGKYSRQFTVSTNPQNITVRSSFGGTATRAVALK